MHSNYIAGIAIENQQALDQSFNVIRSDLRIKNDTIVQKYFTHINLFQQKFRELLRTKKNLIDDFVEISGDKDLYQFNEIRPFDQNSHYDPNDCQIQLHKLNAIWSKFKEFVQLKMPQKQKKPNEQQPIQYQQQIKVQPQIKAQTQTQTQTQAQAQAQVQPQVQQQIQPVPKSEIKFDQKINFKSSFLKSIIDRLEKQDFSALKNSLKNINILSKVVEQGPQTKQIQSQEEKPREPYKIQKTEFQSNLQQLQNNGFKCQKITINNPNAVNTYEITKIGSSQKLIINENFQIHGKYLCRLIPQQKNQRESESIERQLTQYR